MRVIPAIDIIEGKCVRLTQGDYKKKKIYNENPLEVAKAFEDAGLKHLHLVDLDGAKAKHIVNYKVLEQLTTGTRLTIDFGGGMKSSDDLRIAFECGASQVNVGSAAVTDKESFLEWLKKYGSYKIILGADSKEGKITITGWKENTGKAVVEFIKEYQKDGVKYVVSTDILKDGMMEGPSFDLYKSIMAKSPEILLIASGGVSAITDLEKLSELKLDGVIIGKAIYENKVTLKDLVRFNLKSSVTVNRA